MGTTGEHYLAKDSSLASEYGSKRRIRVRLHKLHRRYKTWSFRNRRQIINVTLIVSTSVCTILLIGLLGWLGIFQ